MREQTVPESRPLDHLALCGRLDDPALVLRDRTLSYRDLNDTIAKMAGWLTEVLPEKGARVASWATKNELTCLMPLAAARAGMVHVPINPLLKHPQAAHILTDSGARLLVATQSRLDSLRAYRWSTEFTAVNETDVLHSVSQVRNPVSPSSQDPASLCAILYTSGSTGQPKGVMLSHANLWLGAVSVADYLAMGSSDVTLAVLPLAFDYGQSQLLSTWYAGGSVVPLDYLFAKDVIRSCARHGVTTLAAVPPLWLQLVELDWQDDALASMRRLTNSGGALTRELVQKLRHTFSQADIFAMYGLTEAFRSTYLDPTLIEAHPTSMGSAIPFAEILVIADDGTIAETDEEGELVHCGPLVAQGYWQDAERTARKFKPAPDGSRYGGNAVWSGDRVRRSADGLLYFIGRRDGMIKTAGNRVSPQEIEDAAHATGLAAEAVALGLPDPQLGQQIHLVVRPTANNTDHQERLPKMLEKQLPNFMHPAAIHWREIMPLNPNGKIDRAALFAELSELAGPA